MSSTPEFVIGGEVRCGDQVCGHISRVLIDPTTDDVTHLIVQPTHAHGHERMVPIAMVESAADGIHFRGDRAGFERLEELEEKILLPGDERADYAPDQTLYWPYYGLGTGALTTGTAEPAPGSSPVGFGEPPRFITEERVPEGESELRRGDQVRATDGVVGRIHGFVVEPKEHHITHILLEAGHLWGRRDVTIPIAAVADVDDGVRLKLTREQVGDLPAVKFEHRG